MFDYERYDHTYCRPSRDVIDGSDEGERRLSSASYEGLTDAILNEHLPLPVEADNGSSQNRDPVIIVRTKKARKIHQAPIIVKAMNKGVGSVLVSTVKANSNSIISKKIVCPVQKAESGNMEADFLESAEEATEETMAQNLISKTDPDTSPEPQESVPEAVQTTKSGRTRKLTAKAKQNCEDLKKTPKVKKPMKVKTNLGEEGSKPKKARGRPRKNADMNGDKPISHTQIPSQLAAELVDQKVASPSPSKGDVAVVQESNEDEEDFGPKPVKNRPNKRSKTSKDSQEPLPKTAKSPKGPDVAGQRKKPAATKKEAKIKSGSPANAKRNAKSAPKSKLVVVTKLPPKRRAQMRAQEQAIPAAKIDSNNIVKGNRRRR